MLQPSALYKKVMAGEGSMSVADLQAFLKRKYFDQQRDIDPLSDIDEQYLVKAYKFFIPGRIYTFPYMPLDYKSVEYFDKQPIVLTFYNYLRKEDGEMVEFGLNLNLIPPQFRLALLDVIWKFSEKIIKQNEKNIMEDKKAQVYPPMENHILLNRLLTEVAKVPYQFALQAYVKRIIKPDRVRIISYQDWPYLVNYIPKTFIGRPAPAIWKEYLVKRTELLNKEKMKSSTIRAKEQADLKKLLRTRKK